MLVAPAAALLAGLGLVAAPVLAMAIATQMSARVLDAGIETPGEKLAQTLLPTALRGRVAGFLDGTAKRAGAVLGGLVAAVLAGAPAMFYLVVAAVGALWLARGVARLARELPRLAVAQVVDAALGDGDAAVDDRAIAALVRELDGAARRSARPRCWCGCTSAAGSMRSGRSSAAVARDAERAGLWRALVAVLDRAGAGARGRDRARARRQVRGAGRPCRRARDPPRRRRPRLRGSVSAKPNRFRSVLGVRRPPRRPLTALARS